MDLYDRVIFYDTVEPIKFFEEDPHFFPSVSTQTNLGVENDVDDTSSHFFDIFQSVAALSLAPINLDFRYCPCLDVDSTLFIDWMDLQIYNTTTYLDCSLDSPLDTVPSTYNCPTPLAYNVIVRGGIS